jgi:hypothetical protein
METVRRYPNTVCDLCPTPIYRRRSTLRINRGKFCSRACRNKAHRNTGPRGPNPKLQGRNNPAWKGGVTVFKKKGNYTGVRYVRAPQWALPMARKDGYIMEHRLIMAQMCGFLLTRTEVVNHLNHKPYMNAETNLELWPTNADHKRGEVGRFVAGVANRYYPKALALLSSPHMSQ